MGIFEELAEEFGLEQDSPEFRLAEDLALADERFMCQLVALRHEAGLTQEDLGRAWGRHKTAVSQFERPGADPRLSTIRRYAASIGARYVHHVELDGQIYRRLRRAHLGTAWEWIAADEAEEMTEIDVESSHRVDTFIFNVALRSGAQHIPMWRPSLEDSQPIAIGRHRKDANDS